MKHQRPLAVRIFIRICVVFMAVSLIWVYVVYMFSPNQETWEEWTDTTTLTGDELTSTTDNISWDENWTAEENWIILPEIDPENPEDTEAPILVTEDGEIDEMNEFVEVQLENGETELVRQWDLWDAIQINQ